MEKLKVFRTGFCLAAVLAGTACAESPSDLFQKGNQAYASNQFAQAVSDYESARAQGLRHWILNYNLGNAYFKTGHIGKAVANYRRAFQSQSAQRDVLYNLDLVSRKLGDPLIPDQAFARLFWRMFYSLSINALAVLSSLMFVMVCLGAALFFLGFWQPRADLAGGLLGALVLAGSWFGTRVWVMEQREAVVIASTAEVRGAPTLTANANFTVPEGRRVLILKEQDPVQGWLEIGVPQEGLKGWVPEASVEPI